MGAIDRLKKSCEKEITLSQSGERVSFRKMTAYDLVRFGDIPDTVSDFEGKGLSEMDPKAVDYFLSVVADAIFAVGGEPVVCTTKKPPITDAGTLSVYSFGEDLTQLISEVFKFIRGGDGENPYRFQEFPEKQETTDPAGQNSSEIR
jgi:hypothetical protein